MKLVFVRDDDYDHILELSKDVDTNETDVLHELIKFYFDCRNAAVDIVDRRTSIEIVED